MARTDYHYMVRQLHLAGAPLRHVATVLGLSHQRVQQIVQASGGSWWSRVWRDRQVSSDMLCSFCGLPPGQVAKLVAGPRVYICDTCISTATQVLRGKEESPGSEKAGLRRAPSTSRLRCSFCGGRARQDLAVVSSGGKRVCETCLDQCGSIVGSRLQNQERPTGSS